MANLLGKSITSNYLPITSLFVWLISHQPAVVFSQSKLATNNQPKQGHEARDLDTRNQHGGFINNFFSKK
jgi:hypothetical protein